MEKQLYSVQELAQFANVSVRTLHHYHQVGLLVPEHRTESGARRYTRESLYQLQQILLYKQAGLSLKQIDQLLAKGAPERLRLLRQQRLWVQQEQKRLKTLLNTIDQTIVELENTKTMMTEKDLYAGFSNDQMQKMRDEVKERWGEDELTKSEDHLKQKTPADFKALKQEGEDLVAKIGKGMNLPVDHIEVQTNIAAYFEHMKGFRPDLTKEGFAALADLYVEDERFKAYYEKVADGLAEYISKAIKYFCK
ncbi:MAG: MerR family transcriptional regulator [Bacteroidetes bacterium]|nr:MerR family transcriptional regulator [Bacteroidota bacterium]